MSTGKMLPMPDKQIDAFNTILHVLKNFDQAEQTRIIKATILFLGIEIPVSND